MNDSFQSVACTLLLLAIPLDFAPHSERVSLFPRLDAGQTFRYQIGYRAETHTDTESSVAAPMAPTGGATYVQLLLQVEVENVLTEAGKPVVHFGTWIIEPDAITPGDPGNSLNGGKSVEFTLHHDGQVTDLQGLDRLSSEERAVWQEWVARFGGGGTSPERGVKPGDRWKTDEPISTAVLSGLSWDKESEYVNDAPCQAQAMTPQAGPAPSEAAQETCAVILTTATIKQKSSQKDATPEDYKQHDLRNMGIAKGTNEIVTYISLKTGLVVRATEDANQSMNVIVAKSDGSNRVHYMIDAESHAQIMLLAEPPAVHP